MSDALSIQSLRTTWPRMSSPRICSAFSRASSGPLGELDPAGLAAAAGQHLRLDDDLAAELLGGRARLVGRRREASLGHGDPEALEELLALVLVEVHRRRTLPMRTL